MGYAIGMRLIMLVIVLVTCQTAWANLLNNGGFESGDFTSWSLDVATPVVVGQSLEMNPSSPRTGGFMFSASNADGADRVGGTEISISQVVDISALTASGDDLLFTASGFFSGAFGQSDNSNDTAQIVVEFYDNGIGGSLLDSYETLPIDPIVGSWNIVGVVDPPVPSTADTVRFRIRTFLDPGFNSIDIGGDDFFLDVYPRPCTPGDTDGDGDIDTGDITTAIINFTGAGGSGKTCEDGDTDDDGDVDTADLTYSITNFTGAQAANPNVPDLVYDPATGNVTIDADGADVISFSLQSGPFNAADFSELPAGLTDNIASQIGWTSFNLFSGLTGAANLGAILPAGLDMAGLEAALTTPSYGLALAGGGGGGRLDIVIPEPGTVGLMLLAGMSLLRRRRSARGGFERR